jgi:hypothetical protein
MNDLPESARELLDVCGKMKEAGFEYVGSEGIMKYVKDPETGKLVMTVDDERRQKIRAKYASLLEDDTEFVFKEISGGVASGARQMLVFRRQEIL